MELKGILSVSGKPGLYRMINNKPSGLIIEPLGGGSREFAAARHHQFTPLESIAIFTDDGDSVPIKEVLERMQAQIEDTPLPDTKASKEEFREFLLDILPNHDQERVYTSDIKKLVKWYAQLSESGALTQADSEEGEGEKANQVDATADDKTAADSSEETEGLVKAKPKAAASKKTSKPNTKTHLGGATQSKTGVSKAGGKRKV